MNVTSLSFLLVFVVLPSNHAADGFTEEEFNRALAYNAAGIRLEDALQIVLSEKTENITAQLASATILAEEEIDPETAALIARLEAENHPPIQAYTPDSIFDQVQRCPDIATHRATLEPLITFLKGIRQDSNVHSIDTHVAANIAKLPVIGNAFGVDNPNLGIAAIQAYLNPFTTTYAGYEGRAVSSTQLQGYIATTLNTAAQDPITLGLYSRITSILQRLQNEIAEEEFNAHTKHLFDAIAENHLTQGGCFQGVRNRAYIRYISILNILMKE
jgi:hypothetical protein